MFSNYELEGYKSRHSQFSLTMSHLCYGVRNFLVPNPNVIGSKTGIGNKDLFLFIV